MGEAGSPEGLTVPNCLLAPSQRVPRPRLDHVCPAPISWLYIQEGTAKVGGLGPHPGTPAAWLRVQRLQGYSLGEWVLCTGTYPPQKPPGAWRDPGVTHGGFSDFLHGSPMACPPGAGTDSEGGRAVGQAPRSKQPSVPDTMLDKETDSETDSTWLQVTQPVSRDPTPGFST